MLKYQQANVTQTLFIQIQEPLVDGRVAPEARCELMF